MGAVIHRGVPEPFEGYEIFRKYRFEGIKLGAGATCQVHEAVNISSNSTYAVKVIVKEEAEVGGRDSDDLKQEADIMSKFKHPNVCHFYELFEDKELMFFVLELCEGGTLFEKLEHDIVMEEQAAKGVAKQMFKAVQYLHDKGFVHRDLRPESWMLSDLSEEPELKLTNFRMAVECSKDEKLSQACGTLHYVAPEVLRGSYGRQADTWTIGVLVFLIVYGSYPFDGDSAEVVMKNILSNDPDWSNSCYILSRELKELLHQLLVKEVESRMTLEQALKHSWLPKGQHSRPGSRRGSYLDHFLGKKRPSNSSRTSGVRKINITDTSTSSSTHGHGHSTVPELKTVPGQARRPSAAVTDDLIRLLEKASEERARIEANQKAQGGICEEFSPTSSEAWDENKSGQTEKSGKSAGKGQIPVR
jgi:serine/threonine protein kinase